MKDARGPIAWWCAALALAGACTTVQKVYQGAPLREGRWVLLPVMNFADSPQAGERVESILGILLRARGLSSLQEHPAVSEQGFPELDERKRFEQSLGWARQKGFTYAVSGSVNEWRYREGTEGEPAVGLEIRILEVASGKVVWSASGARTGWGRESVSGAAQTLLESLLSELPDPLPGSG